MSLRACGLLVVTIVSSATPADAQEAASRAVERTIPSLPQSLWFVVPARKPPAPDQKGGLVVVLPGGDGSREFLPWVENGLLAQTPDDCTGVLVTAVKWRGDQKIVWPTESSKVDGMAYTTAEYVRAVVAEVSRELPIDPARTVVVGWSSSGPAIHPLMASAVSPFARAYVAMSVWPAPKDLAAAKGRRYFLDQSPEDQVTKFSHVRDAHAALSKAGAVVRVSIYDGGHGWHDDPLPRIHEGLRWLLSDEPAPKPEWPEAKKASAKGKLENLLSNGGFEKGLQGWQVIGNSNNCVVDAVKDERKEGKQSLRLAKKGGGALDLVTQAVELPEGKTLVARAKVKSKGTRNAWLKVWIHDADNKPVGEGPDLVRVTTDGDWQQVEKSWPVAGGRTAVVQIIAVADGELWVDDVVLAVTK